MSEIKINVDDKYLQAFLAFLETLNYVQVEKVSKQKTDGVSGNATETFLADLPEDSPLRSAIKPMRKGNITAEDLIRESGYVRTDWNKIKDLGLAMDIPQTTEELLSQLTA